jgi:DNA-binding CsgD family transcriptional regulator
VLQALTGGATTEEVADVLGISVHTVRTHLRNVMAKLEVHSKLEAVVMALKEGLIQLQP